MRSEQDPAKAARNAELHGVSFAIRIISAWWATERERRMYRKFVESVHGG